MHSFTHYSLIHILIHAHDQSCGRAYVCVLHTDSPTQPLACTHSHTRSPSYSLTHSLTDIIKPELIRSQRIHSRAQTRSPNVRAPFLSFYLSLTIHTHTHTHTLVHSQAHSPDVLSLSVSVSPPLLQHTYIFTHCRLTHSITHLRAVLVTRERKYTRTHSLTHSLIHALIISRK